ncbi:MAG: hypothetical protein Q9169_004570 [Polycauliona sp. 2 TL-2023]
MKLVPCEEQAAVTDSLSFSNLAYPVYPVQDNFCYVPATLSDFYLLRQHQNSTDARYVYTAFNRAVHIPGRKTSTPCITVRMPTPNHEGMKLVLDHVLIDLERAEWLGPDGQPIQYEPCGNERKPTLISAKQRRANHTNVPGFPLTPSQSSSREDHSAEPDGAIRVKGEHMPFLVLEVAFSQGDLSLAKKAFHWIESTRGHVKFVISIRVIPGKHVTVSVTKAKMDLCPTPVDPAAFTWVQDKLIVDEIIYPGKSTESFHISKFNTLPERLCDLADPYKSITIELDDWVSVAANALRHVSRVASPRNPHQVPQQSPTASAKSSIASDHGSEPENPNDPDFVPQDES